MQEVDFKKIWNKDRIQATQHFKTMPEPEKLAKKQAEDILQRIRINMVYEIITSIVVFVGLGVVFYQWNMALFRGYLAISIITTIISARVYFKYLKDLRMIRQLNVKETLLSYIRLTKNYIQRLKIMVNFLTPTAFITALLISVLTQGEGHPLTDIVIVVLLGMVVGLPIIILVIWITNKKYIRRVYGNHYKALQETLNTLITNENNNLNRSNNE